MPKDSGAGGACACRRDPPGECERRSVAGVGAGVMVQTTAIQRSQREWQRWRQAAAVALAVSVPPWRVAERLGLRGQGQGRRIGGHVAAALFEAIENARRNRLDADAAVGHLDTRFACPHWPSARIVPPSGADFTALRKRFHRTVASASSRRGCAAKLIGEFKFQISDAASGGSIAGVATAAECMSDRASDFDLPRRMRVDRQVVDQPCFHSTLRADIRNEERPSSGNRSSNSNDDRSWHRRHRRAQLWLSTAKNSSLHGSRLRLRPGGGARRQPARAGRRAAPGPFCFR